MRWWSAVAMVLLACDDPDDDANDDSTESCELEPAIDATAAASATTVFDCGRVDWQADLAAWQAAHDCALSAFASAMPAKVVWAPMVIDGTSYRAFVGTDGEPYRITDFDYSGYDTQLDFRSRPCDAVYETDECVVSVGVMCLDCIDAGDQSVLCYRP